MNGSRVRVGEGRFITFVFFFINKKGDSIENKIMEYSGNVVVNLKKMIEFLRFPVIFLL